MGLSLVKVRAPGARTQCCPRQKTAIATRIGCTLRFFFFNDTATTEIYPLSLHDALPISRTGPVRATERGPIAGMRPGSSRDRKSTRLNSSHDQISYAVFCLKKQNNRRGRRGDGERDHHGGTCSLHQAAG